MSYSGGGEEGVLARLATLAAGVHGAAAAAERMPLASTPFDGAKWRGARRCRGTRSHTLRVCACSASFRAPSRCRSLPRPPRVRRVAALSPPSAALCRGAGEARRAGGRGPGAVRGAGRCVEPRRAAAPPSASASSSRVAPCIAPVPWRRHRRLLLATAAHQRRRRQCIHLRRLPLPRLRHRRRRRIHHRRLLHLRRRPRRWRRWQAWTPPAGARARRSWRRCW